MAAHMRGLLIISTFVVILPYSQSQKISNLRLCADSSCEGVISLVRTLRTHNPKEPELLKFQPNAVIRVTSKSAGTRQDLWGGEINGQFGYFPRSYVTEYKVFVHSPEHVVHTEEQQPPSGNEEAVVKVDQHLKNGQDPMIEQQRQQQQQQQHQQQSQQSASQTDTVQTVENTQQQQGIQQQQPPEQKTVDDIVHAEAQRRRQEAEMMRQQLLEEQQKEQEQQGDTDAPQEHLRHDLQDQSNQQHQDPSKQPEQQQLHPSELPEQQHQDPSEEPEQHHQDLSKQPEQQHQDPSEQHQLHHQQAQEDSIQQQQQQQTDQQDDNQWYKEHNDYDGAYPDDRAYLDDTEYEDDEQRGDEDEEEEMREDSESNEEDDTELMDTEPTEIEPGRQVNENNKVTEQPGEVQPDGKHTEHQKPDEVAETQDPGKDDEHPSDEALERLRQKHLQHDETGEEEHDEQHVDHLNAMLEEKPRQQETGGTSQDDEKGLPPVEEMEMNTDEQKTMTQSDSQAPESTPVPESNAEEASTPSQTDPEGSNIVVSTITGDALVGEDPTVTPSTPVVVVEQPAVTATPSVEEQQPNQHQQQEQQRANQQQEQQQAHQQQDPPQAQQQQEQHQAHQQQDLQQAHQLQDPQVHQQQDAWQAHQQQDPKEASQQQEDEGETSATEALLTVTPTPSPTQLNQENTATIPSVEESEPPVTPPPSQDSQVLDKAPSESKDNTDEEDNQGREHQVKEPPQGGQLPQESPAHVESEPASEVEPPKDGQKSQDKKTVETGTGAPDVSASSQDHDGSQAKADVNKKLEPEEKPEEKQEFGLKEEIEGKQADGKEDTTGNEMKEAPKPIVGTQDPTKETPEVEKERETPTDKESQPESDAQEMKSEEIPEHYKEQVSPEKNADEGKGEPSDGDIKDENTETKPVSSTELPSADKEEDLTTVIDGTTMELIDGTPIPLNPDDLFFADDISSPSIDEVVATSNTPSVMETTEGMSAHTKASDVHEEDSASSSLDTGAPSSVSHISSAVAGSQSEIITTADQQTQATTSQTSSHDAASKEDGKSSIIENQKIDHLENVEKDETKAEEKVDILHQETITKMPDVTSVPSMDDEIPIPPVEPVTPPNVMIQEDPSGVGSQGGANPLGMGSTPPIDVPSKKNDSDGPTSPSLNQPYLADLVKEEYRSDADFLNRKPLNHNIKSAESAQKPSPIGGDGDVQGHGNLPRSAASENEIEKGTLHKPPAGIKAFVSVVMDTSQPFMQLLVDLLPDPVKDTISEDVVGLPPTTTMFATLVTILLSIFWSCLACSGKSKRKKEFDYMAQYRGLEEKLYITTKEKENLEESLSEAEKRLHDKESEASVAAESGDSLQAELKSIQDKKVKVESQMQVLQQQLDLLNHTVEQQKQDIDSRQHENTSLNNQIAQTGEHVAALEEKLNELQDSLVQQESMATAYNNQVQILTEENNQLKESKSQLLEEVEGWNERVKDLSDQVSLLQKDQKDLQENVAYKDNELEVLRDCFMQMKALEKEREDRGHGEDDADGEGAEDVQDKIQAMMDVSRVRAQLQAVREDRDSIENQLKIEKDSRKQLEDKIESMQVQMEKLREGHYKAEQHGKEAQHKLDVLSNYFKEKEMQLTKELGEQEALKKQSLSQLASAGEKSEAFEKETAVYRQQIKDLQAEIENVERNFRQQIAQNEKKAHENWLAARKAERELQQAKFEATQYRQKLTDLEHKQEETMKGLMRPLALSPDGPVGPPPPPHPGLDRPSPVYRDDSMRDSPHMIPPPPVERRPLFPPGPMGPLPPPRMPPPPPFDHRPPPPPLDRRSPPYDRRPPPDRRSPLDHRSPPPFDRAQSPPYDHRSPPPMDRRSPPPFDRRPIPPHLDRRSPPPFRDMPPPPPHLRGPPPPLGRDMPPPPFGPPPPMGPYGPRPPPPPGDRYDSSRSTSRQSMHRTSTPTE